VAARVVAVGAAVVVVEAMVVGGCVVDAGVAGTAVVGTTGAAGDSDVVVLARSLDGPDLAVASMVST
jgi:hypothetical protein